jgi:hypothetical protein
MMKLGCKSLNFSGEENSWKKDDEYFQQGKWADIIIASVY